MKMGCRLLPVLCLGVLLTGCSALAPVPDGSQLIGTFQGQVWGGMDGPIQVQLYQAPNGDSVFSGQFASGGGVSYFRGTLLGNTLDGKVDMGLGTIRGQLSADGSQMSGELKLAQYQCTWSAGMQ